MKNMRSNIFIKDCIVVANFAEKKKRRESNARSRGIEVKDDEEIGITSTGWY